MKRIAKELFPWDVLCHFARNRVFDDVLLAPSLPNRQLPGPDASQQRVKAFAADVGSAALPLLRLSA